MHVTNQPKEPSELARRLLEVLNQAGAHTWRSALRDKHLAVMLGCSPREISELAFECIEAGHLVLASTDSDRGGRFVLPPGANLGPARHYAESLGRRAAKIFRRRTAVLNVIAAAEARGGQAPATEQLALFAGASQ